MDLPRPFVIRESTHRIHNALGAATLARLGEGLLLQPGRRVLDLACGSGEMLCTWARDHGVRGTGVDISTAFLRAARARAEELGVAEQVGFEHADAGTYVADEPVDVAACLGASWIGDGVPGTIALLRRSLTPGGIILIGEPYWLTRPATDELARSCHASSRDEWLMLPELMASFGPLGYDVVQTAHSSPGDWDAYHGLQWLNTRRWLDANPDDELWAEMRAALDRAPLDHVVTREHLGWGVFALIAR